MVVIPRNRTPRVSRDNQNRCVYDQFIIITLELPSVRGVELHDRKLGQLEWKKYDATDLILFIIDINPHSLLSYTI